MVRTTRQRTAIYSALVTSARPLSVNEVFVLARSNMSGLGIATVYRNLKGLQEEGRIIQVDVPGHPPRWEVAPANHHHHFLCRTCDKLLEINACPEDIKQMLPQGYVLEKHDILLHGQCNTCAGEVTARAKRDASRR